MHTYNSVSENVALRVHSMAVVRAAAYLAMSGCACEPPCGVGLILAERLLRGLRVGVEEDAFVAGQDNTDRAHRRPGHDDVVLEDPSGGLTCRDDAVILEHLQMYVQSARVWVAANMRERTRQLDASGSERLSHRGTHFHCSSGHRARGRGPRRSDHVSCPGTALDRRTQACRSVRGGGCGRCKP